MVSLLPLGAPAMDKAAFGFGVVNHEVNSTPLQLVGYHKIFLRNLGEDTANHAQRTVVPAWCLSREKKMHRNYRHLRLSPPQTLLHWLPHNLPSGLQHHLSSGVLLGVCLGQYDAGAWGQAWAQSMPGCGVEQSFLSSAALVECVAFRLATQGSSQPQKGFARCPLFGHYSTANFTLVCLDRWWDDE